MKRLVPLVFLLLPMALFAQSPKEQETAMLKKLGLNDSQVTQVLDIQGKTQTTINQDAAQLRLLNAQMEKALLPVAPNMQEINGYITQIAQTRADPMKISVSARVQLRQISGDDNFSDYTRFVMRVFGGMGSNMAGAGGMMGGGGGMMGGGSSLASAGTITT